MLSTKRAQFILRVQNYLDQFLFHVQARLHCSMDTRLRLRYKTRNLKLKRQLQWNFFWFTFIGTTLASPRQDTQFVFKTSFLNC